MGEDKKLGGLGTDEITRSSSVTRLDEGMGPTRGDTVVFAPERNVGVDHEGSAERPFGGRCQSLKLARGGGCIGVAANERSLSAE